MLNGVGDAKPSSVADAKHAAAVPLTRRDSGSDVETDPFFDDLVKKDTTTQ